jgi:group I intron endonuclease
MIVYKTTNLINGKFYVGLDTHNNSFYYGSGTLLLLALKKYGRKNFKKEILEECDTFEECLERERYWVKRLGAVEDRNSYNIAPGGQWGGKSSKNLLGYGIPLSEETRKKMSEARKGWSPSEETKTRMSEGKREWYRQAKINGTLPPRSGAKLSPDHIEKIVLGIKRSRRRVVLYDSNMIFAGLFYVQVKKLCQAERKFEQRINREEKKLRTLFEREKKRQYKKIMQIWDPVNFPPPKKKKKVVTQEQRDKISATLKGKYPPGTHPNYGKKASTEARQNMSKALKNKYASGWNPHKGKKRPDLSGENHIFNRYPELRKKNIERAKKFWGEYWADPENRAKQSQFLKNKWADPEWREKQLTRRIKRNKKGQWVKMKDENE